MPSLLQTQNSSQKRIKDKNIEPIQNIESENQQKAKAKKQYTTFEANNTRFVTKCRWVVEVINSFLKKSFRF